MQAEPREMTEVERAIDLLKQNEDDRVGRYRAECIAKVCLAVLQDRNQDYNKDGGAGPEDNFYDIYSGQEWFEGEEDEDAFKSYNHKAAIVAARNVIQKLSRLRHNIFHLDSIVDIAGYAVCWYHCAKKDEEDL